ncbi:MAG: hypothetical protein KGL48_03725 [Sphingomonadales bacterium]|nr:hypothetical protein [Sphingomonadales bacterium]MDE2568008.1 hypothetical protein [Sphingomonadales bacterium]
MAYVIKVEELPILNQLEANHPRPCKVEWINRGTDQRLRKSSIDVLMRTLFQDMASPSVVRLHRSSGLRVIFASSKEREAFAAAFEIARIRKNENSRHIVTCIFDGRDHAGRAIDELIKAGVSKDAISLLWRTSQFIDTDVEWPEGHSKMSVAGATAGGGVAGALAGVALLMLPGIGPVAAAGAIAASALSSVAAVSSIIGATGGAIARMLTDNDVDSVLANYYEQKIRNGKLFVSIENYESAISYEIISEIMRKNHGKIAKIF